MNLLPRKIGVLDSGLGALSVVNEWAKYQLAEEIIVYADSKRAPWGARCEEELWELVRSGVEFLQSQKIDVLVLGCNTTDALFREKLLANYELPVLGLIEPCIESIMKCYGYNRIVLFATEQTVRSKAYYKTVQKLGANIDLIDYPLQELVSIIEKAALDSNIEILEDIEKVLKAQKADAFILGCTHFPMALPWISSRVSLPAIDPSLCLIEKQLLEGVMASKNKTKIKVYTSGHACMYQKLAQLYYPQLLIDCVEYDPLAVPVLK